jgi:hypothetical protein
MINWAHLPLCPIDDTTVAAREASGVVSVLLSPKLSATCNTAVAVSRYDDLDP